MMKNPNGYGSISKLSGNRRRPFWVRITVGWDITKDGKQKQLTQTLGYYASRKEAMVALATYNANPYDLSSAKSTFNDMWELWSEKHFEKYPRSENAIKSAYKPCKRIYTAVARLYFTITVICFLDLLGFQACFVTYS